MNSKRLRATQAACCVSVLAGCLLEARTAAAEVTLFKGDTWEVYSAGRANVFLGYAFGDALPVTTHTLLGGGVDTTLDDIPKTNPDGTADTTQTGTISKMRVRSGFIPNVLTFGFRRKMGEETTLKVQLSVWGTLETSGQRKYYAVAADFREGYMQVDGPWGSFTGGRFLSLFSRGITETDFLYGHGYGVGNWGSLYDVGPTSGLIGFGVLAASFSPGLMYTTPNLSGIKLAIGIFDPVNLAGSWEATRTVRPEAELTYDLTAGSFKMHLFGNGAYQKLYRPFFLDSATVIGAGYGGRFELGPMHVGLGGHTGKGLGLSYALEGSTADHADATDPNFNELRTIDGYSIFGQYAAGPVDLNLAYGVSRVHLLDADKTFGVAANESLIHTQTGISAGVVYHVSENFHVDLDYMNAAYAWYGGEKQRLNYINTGVTLTW